MASKFTHSQYFLALSNFPNFFSGRRLIADLKMVKAYISKWVLPWKVLILLITFQEIPNCGKKKLILNNYMGACCLKKNLLIIWVFILSLSFNMLTYSEAEASDIKTSKGQTVYVPLYSHIYSGNKERPFLLTATLSIRNIDSVHNIKILSIDYYNTNGKFLKKYIEKPIVLYKLASMRLVVKQSDKTGGSGAKFIIKWKSEQYVNSPIIESIMIGAQNQQGVSFTSRGKAIRDNSN